VLQRRACRRTRKTPPLRTYFSPIAADYKIWDRKGTMVVPIRPEFRTKYETLHPAAPKTDHLRCSSLPSSRLGTRINEFYWRARSLPIIRRFVLLPSLGRFGIVGPGDFLLVFFTSCLYLIQMLPSPLFMTFMLTHRRIVNGSIRSVFKKTKTPSGRSF